jgi:uncharacterized protein YdaU (DUF1376 family)
MDAKQVNYYDHHIGDFNNATRHLNRIERSIYRDLMDVYYDTEKPLPLDLSVICRKIIARSNEEATAVEQVLNEFFIKTAQGWFHSRCEEVIAAYHASTSAKSAAGKASAAKRAADKQKRLDELNGSSTDVQQPLDSVDSFVQLTNNQEPITINHLKEAPSASASKPAKKKETPIPEGFEISDGVAAWAQANGYANLNAYLEFFVGRMTASGKKYVNWDQAFMNCIREDWAKLRTVGFQGNAPPVHIAKPILPVEKQVPALATKRSPKPEGMGSLAGLVKNRDAV